MVIQTTAKLSHEQDRRWEATPIIMVDNVTVKNIIGKWKQIFWTEL